MEEQYKLAVKALESIGITTYPKFADIKITESQRKIKDTQLVITPKISEDFTFYDLVHKYDPEAFIYHELWDQYDFEAPSSARLVLLKKSDNLYNEPGVLYTNKTLAQQRELIRKSRYVALDPVTYVMLQIIRKIQNKEPLNKNTWIRFVGQENKTVGGYSLVGYVYSNGGGFRLGWGGGYAYPNAGVGLSVGLELDSQASSLSEDFYSEGLRENTKAIKELTGFLKGHFK